MYLTHMTMLLMDVKTFGNKLMLSSCGDRQQAWGKSSCMANGYRGPSLATLVQHGKAILKPLAHVHRQGVLHRGLTPDHVLV